MRSEAGSVDRSLLVPPIILASFAMQESTCNPSAVGGAGEQGLMQITPDKCKGAPNGNCKDIVSFLMHKFMLA
jgi:Transglycosylase SLT domain